MVRCGVVGVVVWWVVCGGWCDVVWCGGCCVVLRGVVWWVVGGVVRCLEVWYCVGRCGVVWCSVVWAW